MGSGSGGFWLWWDSALVGFGSGGKRLWWDSAVVGFGSGESVVTVGDFFGSESDFFGTVGLLDGPHSVVLSLFGSDLSVESLDGVEDGSEWSTGGDLGLDLSEERGVRELGHSLESLFLDGGSVGGHEDDSDKGKNFHG